MRASIALRIALAVAVAGSQAALAATAEIQFVNPEKFTDAGTPRQYVDRDANLTNIRNHLIKQAASLLPADQKLFIQVTDIDLAGSFEPWQLYSREVRIVKDIYPPRFDFKFRLVRADGSVVKEGERSLRDPGFLMGSSKGYGGDNLRYEKVMLDEWLEKEFLKP